MSAGNPAWRKSMVRGPPAFANARSRSEPERRARRPGPPSAVEPPKQRENPNKLTETRARPIDEWCRQTGE
jgi:hypothetical protein